MSALLSFAVIGLEHVHVRAQARGLIAAGAQLKWVYDDDPQKTAAFCDKFPEATIARSIDEILDDQSIALVAAAAIPSERAALGVRVLRAGKDYFTDKAPFTSLSQLEQVRTVLKETNRRYFIYYSEHYCNPLTLRARQFVEQGRIGRVLQILALAPHRLGTMHRPSWFYQKKQCGGILTDLGSHAFEQFLSFSGANDATITHARVDNFHHADYPDLEDFGEACLQLDNGTSAYCRVDWLSPQGLRSWGDVRLIITGTKGTIEVRKNLDVGHSQAPALFLVDEQEEVILGPEEAGQVQFYDDIIRDCIERSETGQNQALALRAAELSLRAQALADAQRKHGEKASRQAASLRS